MVERSAGPNFRLKISRTRSPFQAARDFFSADVEQILVAEPLWQLLKEDSFDSFVFFSCLVCLFAGLFMMIKTTESRNFR